MLEEPWLRKRGWQRCKYKNTKSGYSIPPRWRAMVVGEIIKVVEHQVRSGDILRLLGKHSLVSPRKAP